MHMRNGRRASQTEDYIHDRSMFMVSVLENQSVVGKTLQVVYPKTHRNILSNK